MIISSYTKVGQLNLRTFYRALTSWKVLELNCSTPYSEITGVDYLLWGGGDKTESKDLEAALATI